MGVDGSNSMFVVCFVKLFVNFIWPGATLGRVLYMLHVPHIFNLMLQQAAPGVGEKGLRQKHSCNHGSFHSLVEERMIVGLAQLDVGG